MLSCVCQCCVHNMAHYQGAIHPGKHTGKLYEDSYCGYSGSKLNQKVCKLVCLHSFASNLIILHHFLFKMSLTDLRSSLKAYISCPYFFLAMSSCFQISEINWVSTMLSLLIQMTAQTKQKRHERESSFLTSEIVF